MNLRTELDAVSAQLDEGDAEAALDRAENLADRFPDEAVVWLLLAEAYYGVDDPEACREAATRALELAQLAATGQSGTDLPAGGGRIAGGTDLHGHEMTNFVKSEDRPGATVGAGGPKGTDPAPGSRNQGTDLALDSGRPGTDLPGFPEGGAAPEGTAPSAEDEAVGTDLPTPRETVLSASLLLAQCDWRMWQFEAAEARLVSILGESEDAFAWSLLARIYEQLGQFRKARDADRRAVEADPEFPQPLELSETELEVALNQARASLPPPLRKLMDQVPLVVQDYPTAEMAAPLASDELPLPPDTLGLFVGHSRLERSSFQMLEDPGSIFIFKRNLERACDDPEDLIEEIVVTLEHEFAHYLGFEEGDMPGLGLE